MNELQDRNYWAQMPAEYFFDPGTRPTYLIPKTPERVMQWLPRDPGKPREGARQSSAQCKEDSYLLLLRPETLKRYIEYRDGHKEF